MAALAQIANGESGSSVRAKINLALSGYVVGLNADGVTDDAAGINALIATLTPTASSPITLRLPKGRAYALSAPIELKSYMTLDVTGVRIVHIGTGENSIINRALKNPQRSVADAVITADSKTITSATAAFNSADVGRGIWTSAGSVGTVPIFAGVIRTVVNSTTVTVDSAPSASATGVTLRVYDRDKSITIIGDALTRFERSMSAASDDNRQHSVRLCRVDGLVIRGLNFFTTDGKYAILLSDVTNFDVRDIYFDTFSDGLHITGPATFGRVRNLSGSTGDDMVALGCMDYLKYADTIGSVSDVTIDGVLGSIASKPSAGLHLFCGNSDANHSMLRVKIYDVTGVFKTQCVKLESGAGDTLSTIDDIEVDGIRPTSVGTSPAILIEVKVGRISLANIYDDGAGGTAPCVYVNADARMIDIRNITRTTNSRTTSVVAITAGKTVNTLSIDGLDGTFNAATNADAVSVAGQLSTLILRNSRIAGHSGLSFVKTSEQTALALLASDISMSGMAGAYVWWLLGAVELSLTNVRHGVCYQGIRAASNTTVVTVRASGVTWTPTIFVDGNGGGGVVRLLSFDLRGEIDRPGIQKNNGDMAYNTKGALACGVGPVVCNGTNWKNLYTGATY